MHAGDGYAYLLNSVASHDDTSRPELRLHDYYDATGTPPGRWFGRGIEGLGKTSVTAGDVVEEFQMAALYGEGLHPDAEENVENGATVRSTQLGRRYPIYTKGVPVLEAIAAAEKRATSGGRRILSLEERNEIGLEVARPFFEKETGAYDADAREVLAWLNEQKNAVKQAVAGIDLTFSPAKSISVAWAFADEETRSAIEKIHHRCVEDALGHIEDNLLYTRTGSRGETMLKARGMIAARFLHYDTRAGDPDLHTHCLLSNKVQAAHDPELSERENEKWRSIDARLLFQNSAKVGQMYNRMMAQRLSDELGFAFRERQRADGKASTWELAGITDDEIDQLSARREAARPVFEDYVAKYVARHGRTPSRRAQYDLWQAAILETRDAKKPAQSLRAHRENWAERIDGDAVMERVREARDARAFFPAVGSDAYADAVATLARLAVDDARARHASFAPRHLSTAVTMRMNEWRFSSEEDGDAAHDAAIEFANDQLLTVVSDTDESTLPQAMRSPDGVVRDRTPESVSLIAHDTLREEETILGVLGELTTVFALRKDVDAALAQHQEDTGFALNFKQAEMVRHLVESGKKLSAAVGPAGTGKTTAMAVVAKVWQQQNRRVIGLAPSAVAAETLGQDIGATARTLQSLTYAWRGLTTDRARDLAALPVEIHPGDMLLVDEAGMATTADLAALTEIAEASGAVIRLVGDPYQLDAVETGGLFRTIVKRDHSVELDQVMRVGNDTAQAKAGMQIRHGDVSGLDLYDERGWIHDGARAEMVAQAVEDYLADIDAGRTALVIATLREDVNTANTLIQNAMIERGSVNRHGRSARLGTGHDVYAGDVILARSNTLLDGKRILNGTRLTVEKITRDGSLIARDLERGRRFVLPQDYVANHVQLGYASTVHRAQGVTVDVTRAIVSSATDRRGLYVALTRGRRQNHAYVPQDAQIDLDAEGGHWHMSGDDAPASGRDILQRIVARDDGQRSATEVREEMERAAHSPERLRELFSVAADVLTARWRERVVEPEVRRWLDYLPVEQAESLDEDNAVERIATAAVALSQHGIDYRELLPAATDNLFGVRDAGAVIAHRLREYLPTERPTLRALPPLHPDADHELHTWAADVRAALAPDERALIALTTPLPEQGTIEGRDFTDTDLRGYDLSGLKFINCSFVGAAFDDAVLDDVYFERCDMQEATFAGATLSGGTDLLAQVVFNDSNLRRTDFSEVDGQRSVFTACDLRESTFAGATFETTHFTSVDFSGCELAHTRLDDDVTLEFCTLDASAPESFQARNAAAQDDPSEASPEEDFGDVWGAKEESTDTNGPVL